MNGLATEHPKQTVDVALESGVPVCMSALAYLRPAPAPRIVPFVKVKANSAATAVAVGIHVHAFPASGEIVGWPGLDDLLMRRVNRKQVEAAKPVPVSQRE